MSKILVLHQAVSSKMNELVSFNQKNKIKQNELVTYATRALSVSSGTHHSIYSRQDCEQVIQYISNSG